MLCGEYGLGRGTGEEFEAALGVADGAYADDAEDEVEGEHEEVADE